jgi:hypothetical protein
VIVIDPNLSANHQRRARGILSLARLELRDLLMPVWPPLAAPLLASSGNADLAVSELGLYEWRVRIELSTLAYPSESEVLLSAYVRPAGVFARFAATMDRLLEWGWKPLVQIPLRDGTPETAENAMYEIRAALWSESGIRRRVSRVAE